MCTFYIVRFTRVRWIRVIMIRQKNLGPEQTSLDCIQGDQYSVKLYILYFKMLHRLIFRITIMVEGESTFDAANGIIIFPSNIK